MTREEAIYWFGHKEENATKFWTAVGYSIRVLSQGFCEDCVSRQAAIDAIWHSVGSENGELQSFAEVIIADAEEEIKALPSVQPEIIRCKECKEFRRYIDTDITFCDRTECERKPDDFCSYAERRQDDGH